MPEVIRSPKTYDVCIIGSGAAGGAAAKVLTGSVSRVIPLQAAEYAHTMTRSKKAPKGTYKPRFFSAHPYKTLQALCAAIIPAEGQSGGAIEAGVPEFIDLLTS